MLKKVKNFLTAFTKVSCKNKNLLNSYNSLIAVISSIITLIAFFMPPLSSCRCRIICSILFVAFLLFAFIYQWYKANVLKKAQFKINGTNVNVTTGDLFKQDGLKIIGVNNYIDLIADDIVVSKKTLHGQFIDMHSEKINEIKSAIMNSKTVIINSESERPSYSFGSCVLYNDYVLTVLTEFDFENKAYTSIQEYLQFWMTFWKNIDVLYNSRTINIPIMGAGQTRFRGVAPEKQELLEIALWTLKESGFRNTYPDRSINFIIYSGDAPDIDFYSIQKKYQ